MVPRMLAMAAARGLEVKRGDRHLLTDRRKGSVSRMLTTQVVRGLRVNHGDRRPLTGSQKDFGQ